MARVMTSRGWKTGGGTARVTAKGQKTAEEESLYNVDGVPFGIPCNDSEDHAGVLLEDEEGTLGKQRQLLDQLQFISIICGIKNI